MRRMDPERRARASYRQFVAYHLLRCLTKEEMEAIQDLDPHEKGKFLTRLQKALEGDIRYPFPRIQVDRFPSARAGAIPDGITEEVSPGVNSS